MRNDNAEILDAYRHAELYDELHSDFTEDLQMHSLLAASHPGFVLELGIGTGRVAGHLLEKGCSVDGIDVSSEMLAIAKRRMSRDWHPFRLFQQDLRSFSIPDRKAGYSLIIAPFNTLSHLPDAENLSECLKHVKQHLAPLGVFAPTFFLNTVSATASGQESGATGLREEGSFFSASRHAEVQVYVKSGYDDTTALQTCHWYWICEDETIENKMVLRVWQMDELLDVFVRCGFRVVRSLHDYDAHAKPSAGTKPFVWTPVLAHL